MKQAQHFPLVADGESFLSEMPVMQLYEEDELISNIRGEVAETTRLPKVATEVVKPAKVAPTLEVKSERQESRPPQSTPAPQVPHPAPSQPSSASTIQKQLGKTHTYQPKAKGVRPNLRREIEKKTTAYAHLHQALKQDKYILADTVPNYQPGSHVQGKRVLKNSYEFLKTSQVANYLNPMPKKEQKTTQELALPDI